MEVLDPIPSTDSTQDPTLVADSDLRRAQEFYQGIAARMSRWSAAAEVKSALRSELEDDPRFRGISLWAGDAMPHVCVAVDGVSAYTARIITGELSDAITVRRPGGEQITIGVDYVEAGSAHDVTGVGPTSRNSDVPPDTERAKPRMAVAGDTSREVRRLLIEPNIRASLIDQVCDALDDPDFAGDPVGDAATAVDVVLSYLRQKLNIEN